MMTVRTFSAAMLAVVLMAGGAVGQTTPQAEDPHHTAGTENPDELFVAVDEPVGLVEVSLERGHV